MVNGAVERGGDKSRNVELDEDSDLEDMGIVDGRETWDYSLEVTQEYYAYFGCKFCYRKHLLNRSKLFMVGAAA